MKKTKKLRSGSPLSAVMLNAAAYALALLFIIPIVWMIVVAFKPDTVDTTNPLNWFVPPFTMENVQNVLSHPQANVVLWIGNSILIASLNTLFVVLLCSLAAFSFSRVPFWGKNILFVIVMAGMMLPRETMLVPLYVMFQQNKLLNTYFSLIAPTVAAPFAVIVLKNAFDALPPSLFEAAKLDGCSWPRMAVTIAIPLVKPAMMSLAILVFLQSWNDFLWPFISITDQMHVTIPVGLSLFKSQYLTGQGLTMAAGTLLSFPVMIAFFIFQKHIVKGIAVTGIKG